MNNVESAIETARAYLETHRDLLDERDPLREETGAMIREGEPLVGLWREAALRALDGVRSRKGANKYLYRDRFIAEAVHLTVASGFDPYRSKATRDRDGKESACSIVHKALGHLGVNTVTEDAVEKVWSRAHLDLNPNKKGGPPASD